VLGQQLIELTAIGARQAIAHGLEGRDHVALERDQVHERCDGLFRCLCCWLH